MNIVASIERLGAGVVRLGSTLGRERLHMLIFIAAVWSGVALGSLKKPSLAGTLVGGGVGASVSVTMYLATRAQARRQTALDLFKEYYSTDFATLRRRAERFMRRHAEVDWAANDPYVLAAEDEDLPGYGAVLRYWQRFATLHREVELAPRLAERLLARELGFWMTTIFEPMSAREGMYVRTLVLGLAEAMSMGSAASLYDEGRRDGMRRPPAGPARGREC